MSTDFDHYTSGTLEPLADHIIVTNIEDEGEKITSSGIIIPSERGEGRGVHPRWAQIVSVGNEQQDVAPGQWILIEHGRWTRGVKLIDGEVYRKVDPEGVMLVSDEKPKDI